MRHFDLSPFHRSTVGFDRLFSMLDQAAGPETSAQSYPPYNIERTAENAFRITLAVAGFGDEDLVIEAAENVLTIKGEKANAPEPAAETLFQGIAARGFQRRFHLADHVRVSSAELENGLLHISLVRELPEAMKPRLVPIASSAARTTRPKAIETAAKAA